MLFQRRSNKIYSEMIVVARKLRGKYLKMSFKMGVSRSREDSCKCLTITRKYIQMHEIGEDFVYLYGGIRNEVDEER